MSAQASQNGVGEQPAGLRVTNRDGVNETRGARVWQGAGIAGSGWQRAGLGRHAGQGALAVHAAGCRTRRKVWWSVGERRRGLVEKEGGVLERDAWAVGGEAGKKADGSAVDAMVGGMGLGGLGSAWGLGLW